MSGPISRAYGKELWTTYSGNALNRVSFLRDNQAFLHSAFSSPDAAFLPVHRFDPLLRNDEAVAWLSKRDVARLGGDGGDGILGQPFATTVEEQAAAWDAARDASGASAAQVVFLGLDERAAPGFTYEGYAGAPRFAVDVTPHEQALPELEESLNTFLSRIDEDADLAFRSVMFGVHLRDALDFNIIAEGKIILDWINRTRFCGGCGHRNMVASGGFKLLCADSFAGRTACPTHGRITNLSFPRTDCCVIVSVVSHDGQRVLIGRGIRFKFNMYSCLAGFLESGESIEDCVRREVYEEAGVKVGRVQMLASQPWPYPANLMIGCLAEIADASPESHALDITRDKELADAKWVSKHDLRLLCDGKGDFGFVVPPRSSIAWVLLDATADMK